MDRLLWSLPGPTRLLDEIEAEFRDGVSVVIVVPGVGPEDVCAAVRARIVEEGVYRWLAVGLEQAREGSPSGIILDAAAAGSAQKGKLDARRVAACAALRDTVVALEPEAESWPRWRGFLSDYETAARTTEPWERPLFFAVLPASLPPPRSEACLRVFRWQGRLTKLDMQLFVALSQTPTGSRDTAVQLRDSLAVCLAGSDARLAEQLAHRPLADLLHPADLLREYSITCGWSPNGVPARWADGSLDSIDGRTIEHAAWLAHTGRLEALHRRIWQAQVAVLFPWVEEQRISWVLKLQSRLRLPFTNRLGETIDDPADLELGELLHLARMARPPLPKRQLQALQQHTAVRHELAHIRPVGWDRLRSIRAFTVGT